MNKIKCDKCGNIDIIQEEIKEVIDQNGNIIGHVIIEYKEILNGTCLDCILKNSNA